MKKQSPKTERQLLGELYADKAYLEKLLKDEGFSPSQQILFFFHPFKKYSLFLFFFYIPVILP